ncbi:hypothetical protein [Amycolatopsis methanolica]
MMFVLLLIGAVIRTFTPHTGLFPGSFAGALFRG